MIPNSKPTRNSDHRHAQSIARQRNAAKPVAADVSAEDLADILPQDESPMLPDAAPVSTPVAEAPANMPRPSWRDREPAIVHSTNRIFKRHFSAGPAGAQPPWNTPAAMWRIVFTPRRRWVGQCVGGRVAYRTPEIRRWRKALGTVFEGH